MTRRDRLVVSVLAAAAVVLLAWFVVVAPKRHDASQLQTQLAAQQARLTSAQSQVQQGLAAEGTYKQNLHAVAQLYRAVPANDGVPNLLVALTRTSDNKKVDFKVIQVSTTAQPAAAAPASAAAQTAATSTPTTPSAASPAPAAAPAAAAPLFQTISFSFTFTGNYISLQHFLHSLDRYALVRNGSVVSSGRLLTIQGVGLAPLVGHGATATVTAVAYSQPPASVAAATTGTPLAQPAATTGSKP